MAKQKQEDLAAGFRKVDQTSEPGRAVRYLSTVSAMEAVQAARRLAYSLLGVQEGETDGSPGHCPDSSGSSDSRM